MPYLNWLVVSHDETTLSDYLRGCLAIAKHRSELAQVTLDQVIGMYQHEAPSNFSISHWKGVPEPHTAIQPRLTECSCSTTSPESYSSPVLEPCLCRWLGKNHFQLSRKLYAIGRSHSLARRYEAFEPACPVLFSIFKAMIA